MTHSNQDKGYATSTDGALAPLFEFIGSIFRLFFALWPVWVLLIILLLVVCNTVLVRLF